MHNMLAVEFFEFDHPPGLLRTARMGGCSHEGVHSLLCCTVNLNMHATQHLWQRLHQPKALKPAVHYAIDHKQQAGATAGVRI